MSEQHLVVSLSCPDCRAKMYVYEFDLLEYTNRQAGADFGPHSEKTRIYCNYCHESFILTITGGAEDMHGELEGYPSVQVAFQTADEQALSEFDYSEYIQEYMPDDPEEAYYHSVTQLEELVNRFEPKQSDKTFYRMLFVQYVVVMEAYLADRLITAVTEAPEILKALTTGHVTLATRKFPIQALAARPNLLLEETQAFLKSQLFHDMEDVEKIYQAALGKTPFCDANQKVFFLDMAIKRHHCVHRNGKDNDRQALEGIGPAYIGEVSNSITAMVGNIESQIRLIKGQPA
ncbi:MAG: hypothetical protein WC048_09505 [Rhizobium sp.]